MYFFGGTSCTCKFQISIKVVLTIFIILSKLCIIIIVQEKECDKKIKESKILQKQPLKKKNTIKQDYKKVK